MELASLIVTLIFIALTLLITFIPTIIAYNRNHRQRLAILIVNIFLAWTAIGWIAALIWACTADVEKPSFVQQLNG